jgi:alpha-beta hydrolase superfamily lysophospholipase
VSAGGLAESGYEAVELPGRPAAARPRTEIFRRNSAQPSRRAVLHVQAAEDPAAPAELGAWYTARAFHFYLAGLRLPALAPVGTRPAARFLAAAFADLDAACAHLRGTDGMASLIVSASGRGAIAAALWCAARPAAANALILLAPRLPAGTSLSLDIDCPALVLTDPAAATLAGPVVPAGPAESAGPPGRTAGRRLRGWSPRRRPAPADGADLQLGGHVTWLRLPAGSALGSQAGGQQFFDELGRWLGAYMYGHVRDQLL